MEYNFMEHIPSDIDTKPKFLKPKFTTTQDMLNNIFKWIDPKLIKSIEAKSNFMISTRC